MSKAGIAAILKLLYTNRQRAEFGQGAVLCPHLSFTREGLVEVKSEKNLNKETLGRLPHLSVPRISLQYKTYPTGLL